MCCALRTHRTQTALLAQEAAWLRAACALWACELTAGAFAIVQALKGVKPLQRGVNGELQCSKSGLDGIRIIRIDRCALVPDVVLLCFSRQASLLRQGSWASRPGGGLDFRHLTAVTTGTAAAAPGATRHSASLAKKLEIWPQCRARTSAVRLPAAQVLQLCCCSAAGAVYLLSTQIADRLI